MREQNIASEADAMAKLLSLRHNEAWLNNERLARSLYKATLPQNLSTEMIINSWNIWVIVTRHERNVLFLHLREPRLHSVTRDVPFRFWLTWHYVKNWCYVECIKSCCDTVKGCLVQVKLMAHKKCFVNRKTLFHYLNCISNNMYRTVSPQNDYVPSVESYWT